MTNEAVLQQNKTITVIPSGIKRHQHDMNCEDAGCEEIINMRYHNGAWQTVGAKQQEWQYNHQCSDIYYHPERNASGTSIYVGYNPATRYIVSINPDAGTSTNLFQLAASETFSRFTSLSSILVIYTDKTVYYYHWNNDSSQYLHLSQDIKPQVYFSYQHEDEFTVPPTDTTETEDFFQTQAELFNAIIVAKYKMRNKGLFCHAYTVVQWAYRMWDGSYIMHSQPYLLRLSDEEAYFTRVRDDITPTNEVYQCTLRCGKPIFYIQDPGNVITNLEKYKGLITHLCVFMSQDVSQYLFETNLEDFGDDSGFYKYAFTNNTDSLDQLMNLYPLYLAKEVPLQDVLNATMGVTKFEISVNESINKLNYNGDGGESIDTVEKIPVRHNTYSWKKFGRWIGNIFRSQENDKPQFWFDTEDAEQTTESTDEAGSFILQAQPELPIDDFTHHILLPDATPYVYNTKLHLGDLNVKFWKGDDPSKWLYGDSGNSNTAISGYVFAREITIETDKGARYVVEQFNPYYTHLVLYGVDRYIIGIPNVVSYPDLRATKIRIVYFDNVHFRELASYDLKSHKMYNFAYCITNREFLSDDTGYLSYSNDAVYIDLLDASHNPLTTLHADRRYYKDTNRVQVSQNNNILHFPAKYSYQIGNSSNEIRCFASQSAPLSAGQFGQHPLTVFTSQGTYVMQQGNGQVIYSAVIPLNNEIAYKNSICELGGAIVYAATNGIRLLVGNEVQHLSRDLEGSPSEKLKNDSYYVNFINNIENNLVYLYYSLSEEDFLDYLSENVRIVYDNINKELIVSNRDLFTDEGRYSQVPYSYVYNMEFKTWHKIKDSWHDFMMIDSKWYGVRNFRTGYFTGHGMWSITDETAELMDCMIQSRPMKLGSFNFKKIKGVAQRSLCYVGDPIESNISDDKKFGLYLFGSLENNYYKFLKGIKISQGFGMIQYPSLPSIHQSVHHVVLLTAVNSKDFVFSHWEILTEQNMPGKFAPEARLHTENLTGDYNSLDYGDSYNQ